MSIEKGAATFRVLVLNEKIHDEFEEGLKENAYKEVPVTEEYCVTDVSRGRTLWGDVAPVNEDFLHYGSSLYFACRKREKAVDRKTFNELFNYYVEDDIAASPTGTPPSAKRKKELKQLAMQTLTVGITPKMSGIRVVAPLESRCAIVEGGSMKKAMETAAIIEDMLNLKETPQVLTPELLYSIKQQDKEYESYSVGRGSKGNLDDIGIDFLTWLWMASETPGALPMGVKIGLCGNLAFRGDAQETRGSVTTKLSKGLPWAGREVKAAFEEGKKVSNAKFLFTTEEGASYEAGLDETLLVSGFKNHSPDDEAIAPQDVFDDRISAIRNFTKLLTSLFTKFLSQAEQAQPVIENWLSERWKEEEPVSSGETDGKKEVVDEHPVYTLVSDGEIIAKQEIPQEVMSAPIASDIAKYLMEHVEELKEEMAKYKQPVTIIDRKNRTISIIEWADLMGEDEATA